MKVITAMPAKTLTAAGFLVATVFLASCGSFNTLTRDDNAIARSLIKQNTHCTGITRVYSGVAYDFCILNSQQAGIVFEPLALFYVVDALVCTVTDTLVLPYSLHQQRERGNIELRLELRNEGYFSVTDKRSISCAISSASAVSSE